MWFVEKFGPKDPKIFKYVPRKKKIAHPLFRPTLVKVVRLSSGITLVRTSSITIAKVVSG